jgi:hypothetical protein
LSAWCGAGAAGAERWPGAAVRSIAAAPPGGCATGSGVRWRRSPPRHPPAGRPAAAGPAPAGAGSDGVVARGKTSSTRESVVLTFCPPGPEERENRQASSPAGMARWSFRRSGGSAMAPAWRRSLAEAFGGSALGGPPSAALRPGSPGRWRCRNRRAGSSTAAPPWRCQQCAALAELGGGGGGIDLDGLGQIKAGTQAGPDRCHQAPPAVG